MPISAPTPPAGHEKRLMLLSSKPPPMKPKMNRSMVPTLCLFLSVCPHPTLCLACLDGTVRHSTAPYDPTDDPIASCMSRYQPRHENRARAIR
jgi:hypothetical protein